MEACVTGISDYSNSSISSKDDAAAAWEKKPWYEKKFYSGSMCP